MQVLRLDTRAWDVLAWRWDVQNTGTVVQWVQGRMALVLLVTERGRKWHVSWANVPVLSPAAHRPVHATCWPAKLAEDPTQQASQGSLN